MGEANGKRNRKLSKERKAGRKWIAWMAAFAIAAAVTGCSSMTAVHNEPKDEFQDAIRIMHATDLHYLSEKITDHGVFFEAYIEDSDGKVMDRSEILADAFVAAVIEKAPDALILSGDLTFNGEKTSHEDLAAKLQQIEDAGIPVYVMPGNHDLENPYAAAFLNDSYELTDSISASEFEEIYAPFGYADSIGRDAASLSYIAEPVPGLRVLMVDANTVDLPGLILEETLNWVEDELKKAQADGAKVVAVSHQNLFAHSSSISAGFVAGNAGFLEALYEKYGVICNLSGHMHLQHFAQSDNGFTDFATSSLAVTPNQYAMLRVKDGKAEYKTEPIGVSEWAQAQKMDDTNLTEFDEYSKQFFWDSAYRRSKKKLVNVEETDAEKMAEFFADINIAYFGGRLDTVELDEEKASLWETHKTFQSRYVASMLEEKDKNFNYLVFEYGTPALDESETENQ